MQPINQGGVPIQGNVPLQAQGIVPTSGNKSISEQFAEESLLRSIDPLHTHHAQNNQGLPTNNPGSVPVGNVAGQAQTATNSNIPVGYGGANAGVNPGLVQGQGQFGVGQGGVGQIVTDGVIAGTVVNPGLVSGQQLNQQFPNQSLAGSTFVQGQQGFVQGQQGFVQGQPGLIQGQQGLQQGGFQQGGLQQGGLQQGGLQGQENQLLGGAQDPSNVPFKLSQVEKPTEHNQFVPVGTGLGSDYMTNNVTVQQPHGNAGIHTNDGEQLTFGHTGGTTLVKEGLNPTTFGPKGTNNAETYNHAEKRV